MLKNLNHILMNNYKLTIEIRAHSKKEAEAKLELLVQLAAFFADFDLRNLATTFIKYKLLNLLSQSIQKQPDSSRQIV